MALRIIVRTDNAIHAVNVGAPVVITFKTFDVEAPEIENYLNAGGYNEDGTFLVRQKALALYADPAAWRLGGSCDPNSGAFCGQRIAQDALTYE